MLSLFTPYIKFRSFSESGPPAEVNISETVADRSIVTINHIQELIYDLSFYMVTFDLEKTVRSQSRS